MNRRNIRYSSLSCLRNVLSFFLIAMLFIAVPCSADEKVVPDKLSLADAISTSLNINANLKQAEERQTTSLSKLKVAGITTSFDVGTNANIRHSLIDSSRTGNMFGEFSVKHPLGTQLSLYMSPFSSVESTSALGLSLRHPLMKGARSFSEKSYAMAGAKINATIEDKRLYLTKQATVQGVIEAYFTAVQAREQVKVQERAVDVAQKAADGANERAKEQQVTEIEVSRAEINVAQTKNQLNQQREAARGALDKLMIAIGAGVGQVPELTDTLPEVNMEIPTLGDAIKKALENRAELSVYDSQLADQERKLAMQKDKLRPNLDVVAGYNSEKYNQGLISKSFYNLGDFSAGLEYRLPMDKRALEADKDTAIRDLDMTRRMRVYQMEQIAESVRNAYRGVETSKTSIDILSQNLKVAETNLSMAQEMLDEGLEDNRNVVEGQAALTKVESGLLSAKVDLFLAYINLKYAMGEDLSAIGKIR